MNPVNENPALTLWQKMLISAIAGAALAALWHYAGNYYVKKNTAALSRYPGGR